MKKFLILIGAALFITCPAVLSAEHYQPPRKQCELIKSKENPKDYSDPNTSVTFYGDSRGDWVSKPLYGEAEAHGWIPYLNFGSVQNWNVQNLAVYGMTIHGLYWMLIKCTFKKKEVKDEETGETYIITVPNPEYVTATRYAFEIGGNDIKDLYLNLLLFAPWRFHDVVHTINQGQRTIAEFLFRALKSRDTEGKTDEELKRNILLIGSFPAISRGPVSGTPASHCFPYGFNICRSYVFPQDDFFIDNGTNESDFLLDMLRGSPDLQDGNLLEFANYPIVGHTLDFIKSFKSDDEGYLDFNDNASKWYVEWLTYNLEGHSAFTPGSLALMLAVPGEIALAGEMGINYLLLYPNFVYWKDCIKGACWTADPRLFRDLIHPLWLGYGIWGHAMGSWMAANNWHVPATEPRPPTKTFDPPEPPPSTGPDFWDLIIICYLTKKCG